MINVGDKVRFNGKFLNSIGAFSGPIGTAVGQVQVIKQLGDMRIAVVKWDDGEESSANVNTLIQVNKPDYTNI